MLIVRRKLTENLRTYLELFQVIIAAQGDELLHAVAGQLILQDQVLTGVGWRAGNTQRRLSLGAHNRVMRCKVDM